MTDNKKALRFVALAEEHGWLVLDETEPQDGAVQITVARGTETLRMAWQGNSALDLKNNVWDPGNGKRGKRVYGPSDYTPILTTGTPVQTQSSLGELDDLDLLLELDGRTITWKSELIEEPFVYKVTRPKIEVNGGGRRVLTFTTAEGYRSCHVDAITSVT